MHKAQKRQQMAHERLGNVSTENVTERVHDLVHVTVVLVGRVLHDAAPMSGCENRKGKSYL